MKWYFVELIYENLLEIITIYEIHRHKMGKGMKASEQGSQLCAGCVHLIFAIFK